MIGKNDAGAGGRLVVGTEVRGGNCQLMREMGPTNAKQMNGARPMTVMIRNLDAPLGAELHGIDLATPLPLPDLRAMQFAWQTRLVILARGQQLSDPQLLAFSRQFGELDPPGPNPYGKPFNQQFPEINVISNVIENGKPIGNLGAGEAVWHADMTYVDVPPKAAVLSSLISWTHK